MPDTPEPTGLSPEEAARRLAEDGPNALPSDSHQWLDVLWEAIREPMFLLLVGAAALYLVLGDLHEGLLLLFMVCITIGITLFQEGKTARALDALRDLSSPRALVKRNGERIRIPGIEVVRGDLLLLSEGDRVPADGVLLSANNLQIDESLLTGEAWPVGKRAGIESDTPSAPGGEDLPFVWSGTLVVQGDGVALVTSTGPRTEMGKIGKALQSLSKEQSPLQRQTGKIVRILAIAGFAVSIVLTLAYGWLHDDWLQAVLAGIALSMSLLPEEFPVILAVFPAIGAWRLSRAQVLTRRLSAIETLGSITVLCSDKTGTITENRMTVVQMRAAGEGIELGSDSTLGPAFLQLADFASLASKPQPFDPMERAFHQLADRFETRIGPRGAPAREYPLSAQLRAMSQVWPGESGGQSIVAAKGAPETIAALCRLDEAALQTMHADIDDLARQGLRVLAVARAEFSGTEFPESQEGFAFQYLGLVALADPVRAEIPAAVLECKQAGIRVIMITGDYPGTAASIAKQIGLAHANVLSGDQMDGLDDVQLQARLQDCDVCARITPEQKLRIVQALKAAGEIVAMTGDGVNDAPALKAAHVGIAMGGRGTDVAREAASLVLLDDNFASIVRAIRLGRRIFTNMKNAMSYVLSVHVPIAGIALLPTFMGLPILLYPMHIAFLELIIDPACSLAFENEASEANAMRRPPRKSDAPLLDRTTFVRSAVQGSIALILVAIAYVWAIDSLPEGKARAVAFSVLVVANLGLIFANISDSRGIASVFTSSNRIPLIVAGAAIVMLLLVLYLPSISQAFHFAPLSAGEFIATLGFGMTSILWLALTKLAFRRNTAPAT